jgi:LuxR family transcriptional regulator, glucitol operon activator
MRSAVRNTCFAILSSIETDMRETIGDLALASNSVDMLPTDVRKSATERFELDEKHTPGVPPENDIDLIDYTDFADLGKMIRIRSEEITSLCGRDAGLLASQVESMTRARNRVCHSRPLESDDLSRFIDLANSLLRDYPQLQWKELQSVRLKIEQDPTFVLRLEIPAFWTAAADVTPHNLPMVDFDETGFVGRTTETRDVIKHISGPHPLVTIVGEGGVGKSALALHCLYEILDTKDARFDAIVWISLKTRILTTAGVREIHDAVTSTLGIVQAATGKLGSSIAGSDLGLLVEELKSYMSHSRILLVIDNLETLTLEDVRPLLESIPTGSKILLTSRIGLGELELRYKLDQLDKKQSILLARRHAKSLNLQLLAECTEEHLGKYCQALFYNPLLIKWFVSSVSNGAEPERLLSRGNQSFSTALQFCFENLYNRLGESEKQILHVLFAARRQLSQTELFFLLQEVTQLTQLDLEIALNVLHGSSMLKRAFRDRRKADSGTHYALTDVSSEYLARFAPPNAKILERVQAALKKLRSLAELAQVQEEAYPYHIFTVRSVTTDERICAVYLNNALKKARVGLNAEARGIVEHAKSLLPNFSETYRISAIVEGKANDFFKADEEIRIAIDLNAGSSLTHYQYALFLLKDMEDFNSSLSQIDAALQIDPGELTLETARGLVLTRLGRYEEGAEVYERIMPLIAAHPRKWRIAALDQAAECYRRWAEVDRVSCDPARLMAHLERSREILDIALGKNDFDSRTGAAYVSVVEDAVFAAIAARDGEAVLSWLSKLSDAGHLLSCPPFRVLSIDRLAEIFPDGESVMETIKELARSQAVPWRPEPSDSARPPAREAARPKQFGIVKKILPEEKFGFITDGEGADWFFHFNFLLSPNQWETLAEGTRVEFALGTNKKGPCAVDVYRV